MANRANHPKSALLPLQTVAVDVIRFEKNLLQIGFFGATDSRNPQKTKRRIELEALRNGTRIKVAAEFRGSEDLGLPSTADRDKFIALLKIVQEEKSISGKISNPIRFSGYRMIKELGLSRHGEIYEDIMRWGMRMTDTTITSEQTVYLASKNHYTTDVHHVFRSFKRAGTMNISDGERQETFEVVLEDWLVENLNQRYVVPEDFNAYKQLTRPTAKGIFGNLHLWFHASSGRPVEKDYVDLCNLLSIQTYPHLSKIRSTMGLALDELVGIQYLSKWDIQPMVTKKGYKIVMVPGSEIIALLRNSRDRKKLPERSLPDAPLSEDETNALRGLSAHGINQEKGRVLVETHGADRVLDTVEHIEAQLQKQRNRIENPAGLIIYSLENDLPVPASFMSSRRLQELESQKRADKERAAERSRLEMEYYEWREKAVEEELCGRYSEQERREKVREIVLQRVKTDSFFKRVGPEQREGMALQILRKEIREASQLPTLEEWSAGRTQVSLFSN